MDRTSVVVWEVPDLIVFIANIALKQLSFLMCKFSYVQVCVFTFILICEYNIKNLIMV